jgi:hypothetical protein
MLRKSSPAKGFRGIDNKKNRYFMMRLKSSALNRKPENFAKLRSVDEM